MSSITLRSEFGYDPIKKRFVSPFGWQGPRFFAIFGQKMDFCFNGSTLGPPTPEQKKKLEKNNF
jgi:hypothetical protein